MQQRNQDNSIPSFCVEHLKILIESFEPLFFLLEKPLEQGDMTSYPVQAFVEATELEHHVKDNANNGGSQADKSKVDSSKAKNDFDPTQGKLSLGLRFGGSAVPFFLESGYDFFSMFGCLFIVLINP